MNIKTINKSCTGTQYRRSRFFILAVILCAGILFLPPPAVFSETNGEIPNPPATTSMLVPKADSVTVFDTDVFTLDSAAVGDTFEISIAYPRSYRHGDQRYPVVYILDANLIFATAAQIAMTLTIDRATGVRELLLVGIGYPLKEESWFAEVSRLRMRDFSPPGFSMPPPPPTINTGEGNRPAEWNTAGGAPKFLAFIQTELDPLIRKQFRAEGETAGIMGISGGGLFTIYTFAQRPSLFDRYWIGSTGFPDENDPVLKQFAATLRQGAPVASRLFISIGELEQRPGSALYDFIARTHHQIDRMLEGPVAANVQVVSHVFPGESHGSVVPAALTRAFTVLYGTR
jgi:hypothetical protein